MANHANFYIIPIIQIDEDVVQVANQIELTRTYVPEPMNLTNNTGGVSETKAVF